MAEIYICLSGEPRERLLWGDMVGSAEDVRDAAMMLYHDMRSRQEQAGNEPTAAVWIGVRPFEPTVEELMAYDEKIRKIMARREAKAVPETDEPQDVEVDLSDMAFDSEVDLDL